jgi:tetratricopeptide (TPR) repeat protein
LNPRAPSYLQRGLLRQQLGEHAKAVADFSSLLAITPTNAAALLARGQSQAALGEWSLAVKDLQEASRLGANDAEVWRPVEQHCSQLVEKEPDNVAAWFQLGVARAGLQNWQPAEEALTKALSGKLDVTASADALYHRARVRVELDNRPAAVTDLSASLRGRPKFAPALLLRSQLQMTAGEWFASIADLVTASNSGEKRSELFGKEIERLNERIQQEDANWKWWAARGTCQYQLTKYELALADFEKAKERGAAGTEFALVCGFAHFRSQHWEAAILDFDEYIKTNTKTSVVYADRGKAHLQLAHWVSGTRDLEQAIKLGESSGVLWASVLTQFEQRVKSNADDANAHLGVALAHRRLKHWTEAIEHSERALKLKPDLTLAIGVRGFAQAELGHAN